LAPVASSFSPAATVCLTLLAGLLLFVGGISEVWSHGPFPEPHQAASLNDPEDGSTPEIGLFAAPDRMRRGDGLADVLGRNGFRAEEILGVRDALEGVVDVRRLQAGQMMWLHRDDQGSPSRVEMAFDDMREIAVVRTAAGWNAREVSASAVERRDVVHGTVETNLYHSAVGAGEEGALVELMANTLEYDIDFYRDSRRGDTWTAVVDKVFRDGQTIGYGEIYALRYVNNGRPIYAFRFELPNGDVEYYDYEGRSTERPFLVSPVEFTRISSVFSHRRFHPIRKVYRPHYGVDYAAPTGTPVRATADGVVVDAGRRGPNGNMVTLRHADGYVTKYLHLSKFGPKIRAGARVRQKDIIGRVGSTGLSTGPHLDYRLYRHGKPLNPTSHVSPPGPPIAAALMGRFRELRDRFASDMDAKVRQVAERRDRRGESVAGAGE